MLASAGSDPYTCRLSKTGVHPMPTNPFVSLFGRSPIGPMQQHIAKAHECAANLVPFFEAVMAEDWAKV